MKTRLFALALTVLLLTGSTGIAVSANSAQTHWNGTDASGAVIVDGDCPIVVEREILTVDLQEFPSNYYASATEYLAYSGSVTAEYRFYNPSDYTVTATLLFPFGNVPDYAARYDENGEPLGDADVKEYSVTLDNAPIRAELRHSLVENYQVNTFASYTYLPVDDEPHGHPLYTPDLPVTACTFTVSGLNSSAYPAPTAALEIPETGIQNHNASLYIPDQGCLRTFDGIRRVGVGVDNGDSFTVYIIGSHSSALPSWTLYKNRGLITGDEIGGTVTLTETRLITFYDLAMTNWSAESGIREVDWYNAFMRQFMSVGASGGDLINNSFVSLDLEKKLYRWYKYEITLAPGERTVNTVKAPIYPEIDGSYSPPVYTYLYRLSPAMTWTEFGELEVRINTPYHLLENSLGEFQKTSDGYRLTLDHLPPYTELEFELSESEDPEQKSVWKKVFIGFIWAFIMWYIVFPILAVIILAVVIVKIFKAIRRRRQKRLAQRAEPQNPPPDQSENKDP